MTTLRATLLLTAALLLSPHAPAQSNPARPAITGIAFIEVESADAAASEAFYRSLGYTAAPAGGETRYAVSAAQWIEVTPHAAPPAGTASSRLMAVGYTTPNAAALERYLKAKGAAIAEPLAHGRFAVIDPEGNRVYFVQAGTMSESASQRAEAGRAPSHRIIHAGFTVHDPEVEDRFYRAVLGFKPYWYGGMTDGKRNFVSLQVPDGTDWLEYMLLDGPANPNAAQQQRQFGVSDHFSLGVEHMGDVVTALATNGCKGPDCAKTQMGRDGKVQLNVYDPDGTRVEYMEFKPSGPICCSPFTGPHPQAEPKP